MGEDFGWRREPDAIVQQSSSQPRQLPLSPTRGSLANARSRAADLLQHREFEALIDEGLRMATVTAATDLVCHGLTYWEFRPLVEENGEIGWKILQSMAKMLRAAQDNR